MGKKHEELLLYLGTIVLTCTFLLFNILNFEFFSEIHSHFVC
jgi:hypothetical protein